MIEIKRTYDPARGLRDVEQLSGYVFSPESFAHKFTVERSDEYGFEGTVSGAFLRADGLKIVIADVETAGIDADGSAYVILTPECYQVPGRFLFLMLHTIGGEQSVIYAATSSVLDAEGTGEVIAERSALTLEEQLRRVMVKANNVALFAQNVGEIEANQQTIQETYNGIDEALANAGVWALSKNLLKQNFWTNTPENGDIIYGSASMWSSSGGAYMKSISANRMETFETEPTAEQTAGAYRIWHREAGTDGTTSWTEAWLVYWVVDDGIGTSCVTLTGDDIINETDGESYNKAIQYNITANSAYGNTESLYYPHGVRTVGYPVGSPPANISGEVSEMEVGKTYTVSCWARITSGEKAIMKFGWGGNYTNSPGFPSDRAGVSEWFEITGSAWQRISWTFVFNPTGAQYTETTENDRVTRTYNWEKRVIFAVGRKYTATLQLCGFRLSAGGLFGSDTVDTLKAQLTALTARVEALEQANGTTAAAGNLSAAAAASPLSGETGDQTENTEEVSTDAE